MKKLFLILSVGLLSLSMNGANPAFFNKLSAANEFLPNPPEVGSFTWLEDSVHYFQSRVARRKMTTLTAADSIMLRDLKIFRAATSTDTTCFAVGETITLDSLLAKKRDEPYANWLDRYGADSVVNAPLHNATIFPNLNALEKMCESMKSYHTGLWRTRQRPYYYFRDYYKANGQVDYKTTQDSYPSGHGYFAGVFGLVMTYVDPEHAVQIKKITDELTEARLILGAHWASDIEAGEKLGAITFALILDEPEFYTLLEAAKQELINYRASVPTEDSSTVSATPSQVSARKTLSDGAIIVHTPDSDYTLIGATVK